MGVCVAQASQHGKLAASRVVLGGEGEKVNDGSVVKVSVSGK